MSDQHARGKRAEKNASKSVLSATPASHLDKNVPFDPISCTTKGPGK